jgi:NAD(P)H dehydrogenase (quinone)
LSYSPWNDATIRQLRLVRGLSVNLLRQFRAPARCSPRRFVAVLALALGALSAPFAGALAAQKEQGDKIVISGASGQLAGDAIRALLLRGVKLADLVLVTRTPENLASFSSNGAAVRLGDFDKPETLEPAFAGGRALLLVSTNGAGDRLVQHTNAISAARRAGIRHIVYTSFINATADNPALIASSHQLTEEALMRSGVQYTILRNQLYMDSLVEEAAQALSTGGDLYTNGARGKWAPVARRDCAEAAAVVLTTPGHAGKIYEITGPELINHQDLAKLISDVSGRRVREIEVDDATFMARALRTGMPEALVKLQASFGVAMRANSLNIRTDALQILLGRKPESLRDLLVEHKSRLLSATPQLRAN